MRTRAPLPAAIRYHPRVVAVVAFSAWGVAWVFYLLSAPTTGTPQPVVTPPPTATPPQAAPEVPPPIPLVDTLRVEPGATCLEPAQLILQIESWLQFGELDPRIEVDVRGDPQKPRVVTFRVSIDGEESSTRTFDPAPKACLDLHAVVGLAVAMAIEVAVDETTKRPTKHVHTPAPQTEPLTPAPQPAVPPPKRPVAQVKPSAEPKPVPPPLSPRAATTVQLTSAGLLVVGLPSLAGGGQLGVDLSWPGIYSLRFGVFANYRRGTPLGSGYLDTGVVAGRLDNCFGPRPKKPAKTRLRFCFGLAAGALAATGRGFNVSNGRVTQPWVAGLAGVGAWFPLARRFALEVGVDALINLVKPGFSVVDRAGMPIARSEVAPLGVMVGLGAAFSLN